MPIARQETGLNLFRLAQGQVDPIGRPGLTLYRGACHCGIHRFEVHLRDTQITNAAACNCSLCHKAGYLWAFPAAGDIAYYHSDSKDKSLVVDTRALGQYETAALGHQFCSSCGTGLYGTHKAGPLERQAGINVRTILGINPFTINPETADTAVAVHEPAIELPAALQTQEWQRLGGSTGTKTYTGSCQCGAISFAVKTPPLSKVQVKEDNCSICVRRAAISIYPDKDQVYFLPPLPLDTSSSTSSSNADGKEAPTAIYAFGRKFNQFPFCRTCGVACFVIPLGPPPDVVNRLPAEKQAFVESLRRIRPLYVRAMSGVEWDEIRPVRSDEGTEGYTVGGFEDQQDVEGFSGGMGR